ncbi:hypothetical protein [Blastococcus saxobsidens]|uniref:NnrS family protein n=1 Tax=Blastococcus saxobsidens (strain DD2) TaxID=1146883 RepID=H6RU61_BLASD|nr:hypothetical protein [Blastococcus saxobsidens]CCG05668.1 conserved membrane protein of unknown function [Blastococcus saxobsidens DD2]
MSELTAERAASPLRQQPAERGLPLGRVLLLLPGGVALLAGLDAALVLLGLPAPLRVERLPQVHGILLVLGFVGTLVALERAVALRRGWGFTAPAGLGAGALLLISPLPIAVGATALVLGTGALVAVYVPLWRRQPAGAVAVQALGAVLGTGAALLWAGGVPVPRLLPWLAGFLVLTIVGERLELARVGALAPRAEGMAVGLAAAVAAGALAALMWPAVGHPLLGGALLGLAGWLLRYDIARHTVRSTGLPRFMAGCLLAGYAWLLVAGAVWLLVGPVTAGAGYDVVVHAVFLGFVLSMVMAHAPVILPAVLRRPLPYRPAMVVPAVLLHASLAVRVVLGDVRGIEVAWQLGGLLGIGAVLLFAAVAAWSAASVRRPGGAVR